MKKLIPALGALLFAASTTLYAQTPPSGGDGAAPRAHRGFDCSKAQDPKACEERRAKFRERMIQKMEARQKMHEACNGKRGEDLAQCLKAQRPAHGGWRDRGGPKPGDAAPKS